MSIGVVRSGVSVEMRVGGDGRVCGVCGVCGVGRVGVVRVERVRVAGRGAERLGRARAHELPHGARALPAPGLTIAPAPQAHSPPPNQQNDHALHTASDILSIL